MQPRASHALWLCDSGSNQWHNRYETTMQLCQRYWVATPKGVFELMDDDAVQALIDDLADDDEIDDELTKSPAVPLQVSLRDLFLWLVQNWHVVPYRCAQALSLMSATTVDSLVSDLQYRGTYRHQVILVHFLMLVHGSTWFSTVWHERSPSRRHVVAFHVRIGAPKIPV